MVKLRHLSSVALLSLLPVGCSDSGVPTVPTAPSGGAAAADAGKKVEIPKPTTRQTAKGPRTVHPGGGSTVEP